MIRTLPTMDVDCSLMRQSVGMPMDVRMHEVTDTPFMRRTARDIGPSYISTGSCCFCVIAVGPSLSSFSLLLVVLALDDVDMSFICVNSGEEAPEPLVSGNKATIDRTCRGAARIANRW